MKTAATILVIWGAFALSGREPRAFLFAAGIESMAETNSRNQLLFVPEKGQILLTVNEDDLPRIRKVIGRLNQP